jgi:2-iminobutanoate/2-iminopropanoate deaminase
MPKKIIAVNNAPKAIGPYSQANVIACKTLVFTAGQIPLDPATGKLVDGGITEQTHQSLKNVRNILEGSASSLDKVLKTTVFLKDMNDFKAMNEVYMQYFKSDFPARSTVQVSRLPLDSLVEIEAIAYVEP